MCAGAMVLARIDRLVYAASDPKAGAVGSLLDLSADPRLNHRFPVERGLLAEEAGELLRAFFRARRTNGNGADRVACRLAPRRRLVKSAGGELAEPGRRRLTRNQVYR